MMFILATNLVELLTSVHDLVGLALGAVGTP